MLVWSMTRALPQHSDASILVEELRSASTPPCYQMCSTLKVLGMEDKS